MRAWLVLTACLVVPSAALAQSTFTHINAPGPHFVGFRLVEPYDYARSASGPIDPVTGKPVAERARPIQTWIWYPAAKSTAPAMTLGDYTKLDAISFNFSLTPSERTSLENEEIKVLAESLPPGVSPAQFDAAMATPLGARLDAAAEPGRFPVVIYAPSISAGPSENAELCEYLASQGYVVVSSPSFGQSPPRMTPDLEGAETQASDIGFLVGYVRNLPQADPGHLAVVGYSWGGLANVLAAARDKRIDALVDLDGSVAYSPDLYKQATYATEAHATAPLLYLIGGRIPPPPPGMPPLDRPQADDAISPINHMKYADVYRVTMKPMMHVNFAELRQRMGVAQQGSTDPATQSTAVAWMETYTLRFLDAYLKGDAQSRAFLDLPADKAGAPAGLLTTRVTHAVAMPLNRTDFAAELNRQGFDKAPAVYQAFKARDPDFTLTDPVLVFWGYDLIGRGDLADAIAILRLDTQIHPDSWNAFDSLGEAYADHGDKDLAIAAYRQSLVLNPKNDNADTQLKALGATS